MENQTIQQTIAGLAVALTLFGASAKADSYQDVWQATQEGQYAELPSYQTSKSSFFANGVNLLANSANRTLSDDRDILPRFQKLVHPIGICFSGTWKITKPSQYSGYFANGSEGLIIVRASEAMGQALQGDYRAFGIAGKIFPTQDPKDGRDYKTANFFTVDDLGGTMSKSFLELPKSNEPASSFHLSTVFSLPMIGTILKTFKAADSNPGTRQLYQISELGLQSSDDRVTPGGMILKSETTSLGNRAPEDFRKELHLVQYFGQKLVFGIHVAETTKSEYEQIGSIELTEEALADGCDHRLHFQHPRWRN